MIVKFAASELVFELTTDAGEKIVDVTVGDYKVELNTENIPMIQSEMLAVVSKIMSNAAKFKQAAE